MTPNPYAAPLTTGDANRNLNPALSRALIAHGSLVGGWSVFFAGILSGGLAGLIFRTFRSVTFGGDGYFGMLRHVDSHLQHLLVGATEAAFPALLIGLGYGAVQGAIARRRAVGAAGIVVLAVIGALLGLVNGLNHIGNTSRFLRDFAICPLPGLIMGGALYGLAGWAVRTSLNRQRGEHAKSVLRTLCFFSSGTLLVIGCGAAAFPVLGMGWSEFQIAMQFLSAMTIVAGLCGMWMSWRTYGVMTFLKPKRPPT